MSHRFAFTVSLVDMLRKLHFRYADRIDYVDTFVSKLYHPGAEVHVSTDDQAITLQADQALPAQFLDSLVAGNFLALAHALPPAKEYETVTIDSDGRRIVIDAERTIREESDRNEEGRPRRGTRIVIARKSDEHQQWGEAQRLNQLYQNSDLAVTLNGASLQDSHVHQFSFEQEGFQGTLVYDRYSAGSLDYFVQGRHIGSERFVPGLHLRLYQHPFKPTVTKSKVITTGRGREEHERLQRAFPEIVLAYLKSDSMQQLRQESEQSYQTILRSVIPLAQHHQLLSEHLSAELRFTDDTGQRKGEYTAAFVRNHPLQFTYADEARALGLVDERALASASTDSPVSDRASRRRVSPVLAGVLAAASLGMFAYHAAPYVDALVDSRNKPVAGVRAEESCKTCKGGNMDQRLRALAENLSSLGAEPMDKDELIRTLSDLLRQSSTGGMSAGYIRLQAHNTLVCSPDRLIWSNSNPESVLSTHGCDLVLPVEISGRVTTDSSLKQKLRAVASYMGHFVYNALEPNAVAQYPTILDAIAGEKKAICNSGNSLAAILLHDLGVKNVRAASGVYNGVPHMWLELNLGSERKPDWAVYDFTPTHLDPEIAAQLGPELLAEALARLYGGVSNLLQEPFAGLGALGNRMHDDFVQIAQRPDAFMYQGSALFMLVALAGLTAAGGIALTSRARKAARRLVHETPFALTSAPQYEQPCAIIRDLLGVRRVYDRLLGASPVYDRKKQVLGIPSSYFEQYDPLHIALHLVPGIGVTPEKILAHYARIVDLQSK